MENEGVETFGSGSNPDPGAKCVMWGLNLSLISFQICYSDGCQESEGWVEYDDRCYYITQNVEEADFTWYEAQNWCMENGGDLISIHTYEETELVYSMVRKSAFEIDASIQH